MSPDTNQIQLSATSRGIVDHFFCFTCDEYVWDCDHLINGRLSAVSVPALETSQLQSFTYDGKARVLEIEFRVTAPFTHGEIPLPPPPGVIQYDAVPRYVFTKLRNYSALLRRYGKHKDTEAQRHKESRHQMKPLVRRLSLCLCASVSLCLPSISK